MSAANKNKHQINNIKSDTKNIILTILAPTSIFLLAQTGKADPGFSSSIFSILLFAIWSLIFSIGGWYFFVDPKTFGLKKFVTKSAFACYIVFLASMILSITFLISVLPNIHF